MQSEIKKRARTYAVVAVLLAVILGVLCYNLGFMPQTSILKTFSSEAELESFLTTRSQSHINVLTDQGNVFVYLPNGLMAQSVSGFTKEGEAYTLGTPDHSNTNIQVTGVDEADIVKTDGEYIYVVTGTNLSIIRAYPSQDAGIVTKMALPYWPKEIYATIDRLIVLGTNGSTVQIEPYYSYYSLDTKTIVQVYDVSNKSDPRLLRNFAMTGDYFNSRMIGKYVYAVIGQPAYIIYDTVILPKIYSGDNTRQVAPTEIHYADVHDNYFAYTTFVALDVQDTAEEPTSMTVMTGGTGHMYVSVKNIYVTYPEASDETSIYRVHIKDNNLTCEAQGKVPGREFDQFSMDEYNDYFRIATTTRAMNGTTKNGLYVLDLNLSITGKLEDIAPGETIDSARFIDNRAYLSTSIVKRDPFFVIDVENATSPKELGYLKIPGFNRYLHPYDDNHVIGVGRDESNNVKVTLFDVTNVSSPVEMSKYAFGASWSDSLALTDHKAFLFDKTKDLLVLPVTLNGYSWPKSWSWQGAMVFNLTLSQGIVLKGNITHQEYDGDVLGNAYWIKRSFYIGNVLYTVSDAKMKLNNLEDLAFIKEIKLN